MYSISNLKIRKKIVQKLVSIKILLKLLYLTIKGTNQAQQKIRKLEIKDIKVQKL